MDINYNQLLEQAIHSRRSFIRSPYNSGFRLFNGFQEGIPDLIIDVFAKTIVFHDYSDDETLVKSLLPTIKQFLPWIRSGIVKKRRSKGAEDKVGTLIFGDDYDRKIIEDNVHYALRLLMNQDASFYLDTRNLRQWLKSHMKGKSVLNTFAYTGSLGVAALCGGASEVIQLDLNRQFLSVAQKSTKLNHFEIIDGHYQNADFFSRINQFKKSGKQFDCVILDPPVYSKTSKGIIDIVNNFHRLINKVRPIISHNGYLITINNALFQTGEEHHAVLKELCNDGYLSIEDIIPVPADCVPTLEDHHTPPISDPSPYNSSTKITVLRVTKKDH